MQVEEGTHGLMCSGGTIFSEGLALGSTWNMELLENIYAASASEARAVGIHHLFTLVVEPNIDPRYRELDNCFLLPHIGSATRETRDAMGFRVLDNLDAVFVGKTPQDLLT